MKKNYYFKKYSYPKDLVYQEIKPFNPAYPKRLKLFEKVR